MPGKVVFVFDEPYDVYIGRGMDPHSRRRPMFSWGNWYSHLDCTLPQIQVKTVEEAVCRHREDVLANPELIERIKRELKGKVLGCWCNNKAQLRVGRLPCHGDILVKIANEE